MIKAPKSLREINSFSYVAIPSPKDIFNRFGFDSKLSDNFGCEATDIGLPMKPCTSVISQMINGQTTMLEDLSKH